MPICAYAHQSACRHFHFGALQRNEVMGPIEISALLLLSGLWGSGFLAQFKVLEAVDIYTMVFVRFFFGWIIMTSICILYYTISSAFRSELQHAFSKEYRKRTLLEMLLVSLCFNVIGALTVAQCELHISTGVVAIIFSLEPITAAVFLSLVTGQTPAIFGSYVTIGGCVLALVGCILVAIPDIAHGPSESIYVEIGYVILAFVSTSAYGAGVALTHKFSETNLVNPLVLVCGNCFFGWVFALGFELTIGDDHSIAQLFSTIVGMSLIPWISTIYMALFGTVVCWVLFVWLVQRVGAAGSLYAFIVPCISLILGILINDEWVGFTMTSKILQVFGLCVVLLGLYFILKNDLSDHPDLPVIDEPLLVPVSVVDSYAYQPMPMLSSPSVVPSPAASFLLAPGIPSFMSPAKSPLAANAESIAPQVPVPILLFDNDVSPMFPAADAYYEIVEEIHHDQDEQEHLRSECESECDVFMFDEAS